MHRGVRRGCSLSGLLYTISIEPLLRMLREVARSDFSIILNTAIVKLTAYADDITVIIRSEDDANIWFHVLISFSVHLLHGLIGKN